MNCSFFIILLVVVCSVKGESHTVISQLYSLDGDFNKIWASAFIEFELMHVDNEPSVIIEAEQWMHAGGFITVSTRPNDRLYS